MNMIRSLTSIFLKIDVIELLPVDFIKRSMRTIRSWLIFLKDQREQFDHGQSFLKIEKSERAKIERLNSQPCRKLSPETTSRPIC